MTALNHDLLSRIETHIDDVSRLVSRTVRLVADDRQPGPQQALQCVGASTVCAQLVAIIDRRCRVFRASADDAALRAHLASAADRFATAGTLIRDRAAGARLEPHLDESFGDLAAAVLALGRARHPVTTW